LSVRCVPSFCDADGCRGPVGHPARARLEREAARSAGAGSHRRRNRAGEPGGRDNHADRDSRRQALREAVDHDDALRRESGERRQVDGEERVDGVLDGQQVVPAKNACELGTPPLGHRCADGIVQRGLTVDGAKRRFHVRHGQRIRLHPSIVHRNRDELDARARGHRLEHRICQRVGSQTLSGPQNGGQDCAKTLLAVTGE
jgi:hypothetical protein